MGIKKKVVAKPKKAKHSNYVQKIKKSKTSKSLNNHDDNVEYAQSDDMSDSGEMMKEYEKVPRNYKSVNVRNLLPVKNKQGLVFRSYIVSEDENDTNAEVTSHVSPTETKNRNLVQSYSIQQKCLNNLKRKVALLCTSLIEDPDNNMPVLKELISMFQNPSTKMIISEQRIMSISLLRVFLDILPGYRIRMQKERDPKVKLKKETRKLLGYEKTLLKCYEKYIDLLYKSISKMKSKMESPTLSVTNKRAAYEIGIVSVKCMCELLAKKFSFNYSKDIANKLVPISVDADEKVNTLCCEAFKRVFKADKLGEASFNVVKQIVDVIEAREFCVPVNLLKSFYSLNLREAKPEIEKIDMEKGRKQWRMMSRTQRRDKKKIKDLEAELKEAEAYESVENVRKFHTATLNKIFWVFFHILRDGKKVDLVPPALAGLSKFAYLINLEFFDDLNSVLCGMMENGQLSDVEKLHGVYTLFTVLAGQAESLHVDPHRIYCHMYQALLHLNHMADTEHFDLTLKCLEFNILRKKKKISMNRILAFMKRVSLVSLQTPIHGTLGLLSSVRNILLNVTGSDILLDSESAVGSGIYYPEMEDPEHCNPKSTALWELHLLRKHYNPVVQVFSSHLLNGCPSHGNQSLPGKLSKSSPEGILHLFAEIAVKNKMDFLEDTEEPPRKKIKTNSYMTDFCFENEVDLKLNLASVSHVNFFANI